MFLMHFVDAELKNLSTEQQSLVKKWLVKLGSDTVTQGIDGKMRRNSCLTKLLNDMMSGNLPAPFNTQPDMSRIPDLDDSKLYEPNERPDWLDKLMTNEANKVHVGGKNFETYLSTKIFENGRGACAYLAVSVQNEGDGAAWVKFRPNQEQRIHQMFQKEMKDLDQIDQMNE